jgi:hypothetical protein
MFDKFLNISNIFSGSGGFVGFLTNPPFPVYFLVLKIIFILAFLFFLFWIIYFIKHTHYLEWLYLERFRDSMTRKDYGVKRIDSEWNKIIKRLEGATEADYKLAIIEADGMLDDVLKKLGFKGESLGDRLKTITTEVIFNLDDVWKAHNVRSCIVRDPNYQFSLEETKKTLAIYEKAFKSLDVF